MSERLPRLDHCLNCGHAIESRYCPECGQRNENRTVSLRVLLADIFDDLANLDSRLFRTLGRLLVSPGHLTREYVAGRRTFYMTPFRLYLAASVLFFLVLFWKYPVSALEFGNPFIPEIPRPPELVYHDQEIDVGNGQKMTIQVPEAIEPPPLPAEVQRSVLRAKLEAAAAKLEAQEAEMMAKRGAVGEDRSELQRALLRHTAHILRQPADFARRLQDNLPKMMFLLLPFFALLLKVLYLRSDRFYVEHLIFALHAHAFVFLVAALSLAIDTQPIRLGGAVLSTGYLFLAMHTVYEESWLRTAVKLGLLALAYAVLVAAYLGAAILLIAAFT